MIVLSCDVTQILSGTKNALKMHLSSNTKRINQIPITIFWRTNTAKDKFCIYLTLKRYRIQSVLYHWNQITENQNLEKLRFQSVSWNLNMMVIRFKYIFCHIPFLPGRTGPFFQPFFSGLQLLTIIYYGRFSQYDPYLKWRNWPQQWSWWWFPPNQTTTQKLKSGFHIFGSQEICSDLGSFKMIFEVLQSELFRFKSFTGFKNPEIQPSHDWQNQFICDVFQLLELNFLRFESDSVNLNLRTSSWGTK